MLQIVSLVLPLFGLIVLGYLAARWRRIPLEGLAWLNFFTLYVALPALLFQLLIKTPLEEFASFSFLWRTTFGTFCVFALCFLLARMFGRGGTRVATIQGYAGAYGNIGYMGPPLAIAVFGPEAGVPVALVFCLDNSMHFTLAPLLMAIGGERRKKLLPLLADIVRSILTHPIILATIAAITGAYFRFQPPAAIDQLLDSLAAAAAPCALFSMGVTAALRPLKRVPAELLYLVPVKLLLHPLLVYLLIYRLPGISSVWVHTAVLLAALPTATNVFVLAQQYSVWEERASSAIVISTLISIVTVPLYLYLATLRADIAAYIPLINSVH